MREVLSAFWSSIIKLINLFNRVVNAADESVQVVERAASDFNEEEKLRADKRRADLRKELGLE